MVLNILGVFGSCFLAAVAAGAVQSGCSLQQFWTAAASAAVAGMAAEQRALIVQLSPCDRTFWRQASASRISILVLIVLAWHNLFWHNVPTILIVNNWVQFKRWTFKMIVSTDSGWPLIYKLGHFVGSDYLQFQTFPISPFTNHEHPFYIQKF